MILHLRMGVLLLFASSLFNVAAAHADPPTNPPLITSIDVTDLVIHDATTSNIFGGENSVLNDGGPVNLPATNMAEFLVVTTIDWGDDHGVSVWTWQAEYHFTTHVNAWDSRRSWTAIGPNSSPSRDYGTVFDLTLPGTSPPATSIANHNECSPLVEPTFDVRAFELDQGGNFLTGLASAIVSDVMPQGGDTVAYLLDQGLNGINGNDELTANVGAPNGKDDSATPEVEIDFRVTTLELPSQAACNAQTAAAFLQAPPRTPPNPPRRIPNPPEVAQVTLSDAYFKQTQVLYLETAKRLAEPGELASQWSAHDRARLVAQLALAAQVGLDTWHPLSRNLSFAQRKLEHWQHLLQTFAQALPSEATVDAELFAKNKQQAQGTLLGLVYHATAQLWAEGAARELDSEILAKAESLMLSAAKDLAQNNDYTAAAKGYAQAALLLIGNLYPAFQRVELEL